MSEVKSWLDLRSNGSEKILPAKDLDEAMTYSACEKEGEVRSWEVRAL